MFIAMFFEYSLKTDAKIQKKHQLRKKTSSNYVFFGKNSLISINFCTFAAQNDYNMKFIAIIPARYASTRFPGKPLAVLGGKYVVQRVYEKAAEVIGEAYVATDDQRIYDAVRAFGGKAVMTSTEHKSGTDRIEEAVGKIGSCHDVIINIQGDEPFIHRSQIETICRCFDDESTQIATLGKPFGRTFADLQAIENPNSPKIVIDNNGYAMYFSRSVIPFVRGRERQQWPSEFPFLKHIGLYAYRRQVLHEITRLPQSTLEIAESLEQLRWLQNGYRIKVGITELETIGIDTPADLEAAEYRLKTTGADASCVGNKKIKK